MNKMRLFHLVAIALLSSFAIQAVTIIIIVFRLKVPDMQMVFEIHEYNGLIMAGLVIAHIILNWGWIKANMFKRAKVK